MKTLILLLLVTVFATRLHADTNALCAQFDTQIEALDVRGAKQTIDKALQEDGGSCHALYRLARVLVLMADQESDEQKRSSMYAQAVDAANKALQKNGSCMGAYVYRAAANGKIALSKGIFTVGGVVKISCTSPPSSAVSTGAPPLNGTETILVLVSILNSSAASAPELLGVASATFSAPGLARARAINS